MYTETYTKMEVRFDNACTLPCSSPPKRSSWRRCRTIKAFVCCKMRMMDCHETTVTLSGAERTVSLRTEQLRMVTCRLKSELF